MKRNDLIKALRDETNDIEIPDVSKKVKDVPITIVPIEIRPVKKKSRIYSPILQVFIVFALSLGILYSIITKAETKVTIDINPSIEFTVNRFDKVIGVKAYNETGEEFLQSLNINYCTTDEAISRIIAHAEQKGYLSSNCATALLYSISSISGKSYEYDSKLKRSFESAFSEIGVDGVFHTVEYSPIDEQEAMRRGMSPAKLAFIRELYGKKFKREYKPNEIPNELNDDSVNEIVSRLSA